MNSGPELGCKLGCKPGARLAVSAELDIWLVDLEAGGEFLQRLGEAYQLIPALDAAPNRYASRSSPGQARQDAARVALRVLLAGYVGMNAARQPFVIGPTGKPGLAAIPGLKSIEFSLSHCEAAALIAISETDAVGIDIETVRPVRINPERRAMLESASALLSPGEPLPLLPDDRRFLQAWVRLEALAKATGEGISALLGRLGIRGRSPLSVGTDGTDRPPMFVRDLQLDVQVPLQAAIASAHLRLGADMPSPVAKSLPLDRAFLEDLVSGHVSCRHPRQSADGG